jgi:hypothetical protein
MNRRKLRFAFLPAWGFFVDSFAPIALGTPKFDQTVIDDIHIEEKQRIFIASIASMTHSLEIKVCSSNPFAADSALGFAATRHSG